MAWYDAITNPIRGIGRILRGKFKEGVNDIADSAATLSPALGFIPGVGVPLAAGIGGIAGLLDEVTDAQKGVNWMRPVSSAAGGAAGGAASNAVGGARGLFNSARSGLSGIGNLVGGGGGGAATTTSAVAPGIGVGGGTTLSLGSAANAGAGAAGGMDALTKVALGSQVAGSAADAYGAHQMGKVEDRRLSLEEEEVARRRSMEDARLARRDATDPIRAALLKEIMSSYMAPSVGA